MVIRVIRSFFLGYLNSHLSEDEKNFYLDDVFLQHIYDSPLDERHVGNIGEAIVNAQTNGRISLRGLKKPQQFKHNPLKGLFKVHCEIVTLKQIAKNLQNQKSFSFDENGKLNVTEDGWNAVEEAGGVEKYCEKIFAALDKKAEKRTKTGFWLIYGKYQGTNHYLYLDLEYSHEQNRDEQIYNRLISLYPHEQIEMLKSGK